jgi:hypothetical protein
MLRIASIAVLLTLCCGSARAEFRSAKDMQKECRVALDVLHQRADKSFENVLFTGECIGYLQAATDASLSLTENVKWYKFCLPSDISTELLMQKFIAFVDKYPNTLSHQPRFKSCFLRIFLAVETSLDDSLFVTRLVT